MNAFALFGLGGVGTITPDQINAFTNIAAQQTSGSKAGVVASGAAAGAALGTSVPVIGTAVGAVLGAMVALIKLGTQPATHTVKRLTINDLEYMELIPKDPANGFRLLVLIDAQDSTPVPKVLRLPTPGITSPLKREYEGKVWSELTDRIFSLNLLSKAKKNPNELITYKFPQEIIDSVQAKGYDFNKVDRLVLTAPDGSVYSIRGNQVFSNMQAPGKPGESPAIMQAGFGWIGALIALSIVGGLWWSASKAEKKKESQSK